MFTLLVFGFGNARQKLIFSEHCRCAIDKNVHEVMSGDLNAKEFIGAK